MNVDLVQLAGHRGRLHERPTVDQVTAEVIRGAMETICFEMATYVSRTATTPILNQSNERNATILDAQGRLAALSVGIPQFMLTSTLPVRFALEYLGVDEFHEGDVFVANDPYHGGGHLPDYNVFAPVFGDDPNTGERRMVLIASIQCHHGDTGGDVPGGYNVDRQRHLGRGRALAGREGDRPGRRASRRALRDGRQQPTPGLHRRPARRRSVPRSWPQTGSATSSPGRASTPSSSRSTS